MIEENIRVRLFTHTDLDGVGCAILAKMAFVENVEISYCDYDKINQEVKEYILKKKYHDMIHLTDISVNDTIAMDLNMIPNVTLLDHHPTAAYLNKYSWAKVDCRDKNERNMKTCGTEMYYHWLVNKGYLQQNDFLISFVSIVRDWDTWRWVELGAKGTISKNVNDLLGIYGIHRFIDKVFDKIFDDNTTFKLTRQEEELLDIKQDEVDRMIDRKSSEVMIFEKDGYQFGAVYCDKYISEIGNVLCYVFGQLDFIALFDMNSGKVHLRAAKNDIDVGKIAAKHGGGGHPKSAAFVIREEYSRGVIQSIMGLD